MGGLGALRIAFKHPGLFAAVAALEPAIEPKLRWEGVGPETRFWRPETVLYPIFGEPVDATYWEANNPATIAHRDPERLLDLGLYLEVGDQDSLFLYEGAEFLHRVLFDARLAHEYRLVHGADHVGASLGPRMANGLDFIGRFMAAPSRVDESVVDLRSIMDRLKTEACNQERERIRSTCGTKVYSRIAEFKQRTLSNRRRRNQGRGDGGRLSRLETSARLAPEG